MCLFMSFFVPYCCNMQCGCYAFGDVSGLSERLTAELTFGCGDSIPGSGALMAPLALLQLLGHEAERRYNSVSRQADPTSLRTCPPCLLPPPARCFSFSNFLLLLLFLPVDTTWNPATSSALCASFHSGFYVPAFPAIRAVVLFLCTYVHSTTCVLLSPPT